MSKLARHRNGYKAGQRSFRGSLARKSLGLRSMVACKITAAKDDNGKLGKLPLATVGRSMITAIAVHKDDQRPGCGFFVLARKLGRDVSNEDKFWLNEVKRVFHDFC
jgi:hypothetical protein